MASPPLAPLLTGPWFLCCPPLGSRSSTICFSFFLPIELASAAIGPEVLPWSLYKWFPCMALQGKTSKWRIGLLRSKPTDTLPTQDKLFQGSSCNLFSSVQLGEVLPFCDFYLLVSGPTNGMFRHPFLPLVQQPMRIRASFLYFALAHHESVLHGSIQGSAA